MRVCVVISCVRYRTLYREDKKKQMFIYFMNEYFSGEKKELDHQELCWRCDTIDSSQSSST